MKLQQQYYRKHTDSNHKTLSQKSGEKINEEKNISLVKAVTGRGKYESLSNARKNTIPSQNTPLYIDSDDLFKVHTVVHNDMRIECFPMKVVNNIYVTKPILRLQLTANSTLFTNSQEGGFPSPRKGINKSSDVPLT